MNGNFQSEHLQFSKISPLQFKNHLFLMLLHETPKNIEDLKSIFDLSHPELLNRMDKIDEFLAKNQTYRAIEYISGESQLIQLKEYAVKHLIVNENLNIFHSSKAHSKTIIGTIISTNKVGLDIEEISFRSKIFEETYFIPQEYETIRKILPKDLLNIDGVESTVLWALKEATFKIQKKQNLGQIRQIHIYFKSNCLIGHDDQSNRNYDLLFSIIKNHVIAIASE